MVKDFGEEAEMLQVVLLNLVSNISWPRHVRIKSPDSRTQRVGMFERSVSTAWLTAES